MNNAEDKIEISKISAMILNENTGKIAFYENVNSASKEMAFKIEESPSLAAWLTLFVPVIDRSAVDKVQGVSNEGNIALERLYAIAHMLVKTTGFNPVTTELSFTNESGLSHYTVSFAKIMNDARKALDKLPGENTPVIII